MISPLTYLLRRGNNGVSSLWSVTEPNPKWEEPGERKSRQISPSVVRTRGKKDVPLLGDDDLDTGKRMPINASPQLTKTHINTTNQLADGALFKPPAADLHTSLSYCHSWRCAGWLVVVFAHGAYACLLLGFSLTPPQYSKETLVWGQYMTSY